MALQQGVAFRLPPQSHIDSFPDIVASHPTCGAQDPVPADAVAVVATF